MSDSKESFETHDANAGSDRPTAWTTEFGRIFVLAAKSHGKNARRPAVPHAQKHPHKPSAVGAWLARWALLARFFILVFAIVLAVSLPTKASEAGDWTVVTMGRNGSWGVATSPSFGRAIASAIRDCRAMAGVAGDCGAQFSATQGGWAVANLCGDRKIIVAASRLETAETAAHNREARLRAHYVPDLPPCRRALTVEPSGMIAITDARNSLQGRSLRY